MSMLSVPAHGYARFPCLCPCPVFLSDYCICLVSLSYACLVPLFVSILSVPVCVCPVSLIVSILNVPVRVHVCVSRPGPCLCPCPGPVSLSVSRPVFLLLSVSMCTSMSMPCPCPCPCPCSCPYSFRVHVPFHNTRKFVIINILYSTSTMSIFASTANRISTKKIGNVASC
jgi:hypothetical protein